MCSRGFVSEKGHFMGIQGSAAWIDTPRLRSPESLVCTQAARPISIPRCSERNPLPLRLSPCRRAVAWCFLSCGSAPFVANTWRKEQARNLHRKVSECLDRHMELSDSKEKRLVLKGKMNEVMPPGLGRLTRVPSRTTEARKRRCRSLGAGPAAPGPHPRAQELSLQWNGWRRKAPATSCRGGGRGRTSSNLNWGFREQEPLLPQPRGFASAPFHSLSPGGDGLSLSFGLVRGQPWTPSIADANLAACAFTSVSSGLCLAFPSNKNPFLIEEGRKAGNPQDADPVFTGVWSSWTWQ